jgi:hypothetical protein
MYGAEDNTVSNDEKDAPKLDAVIEKCSVVVAIVERDDATSEDSVAADIAKLEYPF